MPSVNYGWHDQKSAHNYDAYRYLRRKSPRYVDWEIIAIFYSACKMVDACLMEMGHDRPTNHKRRNDLVRSVLQMISDEYMNLYQLSIIARYEDDVGTSDRDDARAWHATIAKKLSCRSRNAEIGVGGRP